MTIKQICHRNFQRVRVRFLWHTLLLYAVDMADAWPFLTIEERISTLTILKLYLHQTGHLSYSLSEKATFVLSHLSHREICDDAGMEDHFVANLAVTVWYCRNLTILLNYDNFSSFQQVLEKYQYTIQIHFRAAKLRYAASTQPCYRFKVKSASGLTNISNSSPIWTNDLVIFDFSHFIDRWLFLFDL